MNVEGIDVRASRRGEMGASERVRKTWPGPLTTMQLNNDKDTDRKYKKSRLNASGG